MKTTEKKFKELRISADPSGTYSVIIDGVVKVTGVSFSEIVEVVRALEESYEQVQQ